MSDDKLIEVFSDVIEILEKKAKDIKSYAKKLAKELKWDGEIEFSKEFPNMFAFVKTFDNKKAAEKAYYALDKKSDDALDWDNFYANNAGKFKKEIKQSGKNFIVQYVIGRREQ